VPSLLGILQIAFCVCFATQIEMKRADGRNVVGNIYCDQPTDHVVHSSPSWYDNVLSSGKPGGVRSPLAVIGRSPGGRKLTKGDLAAKKAALHGGDLASAKKAVAELMATVEMNNCKENASPCVQQRQRSSKTETLITTDKPVSISSIQTAGLKNSEDEESVLDSTFSIDEETEVDQGLLMEQKDEDVFDADVENKENVFHSWSADEVIEIRDNFDVEKQVGEIERLDKQARTLRRRSQLSTDSSEYERILEQLRLVRQRQAELEKLHVTLRSRLLHCQSTSAVEKPLNLKLNSENEVKHVDQEPLDLRIVSVKQCQELTHDNNERVILADITSKVVGNADPNDCFEIPDSPPAAATDADNSSPVEDAAEMDGVHPLSENFEGEHTARVETEREFVESDRKKSTPLRSSPADCSTADVNTPRAVVSVLDHYLASLNVSDISEMDSASPTTGNVASPDTSSEFSNYQAYQRSLDVSGRCIDPIAAVLLDGDDQVCYRH